MLANELLLGTRLYQKQLAEFSTSMVNYMGITHALYVDIDKHGKAFSVCTHDKWMERVLEKQYYKADPLMVHPNNIHNGFAFDDAIQDRAFSDAMQDATTHFKWCHGFSYIEKTTDGGYYGFNFGTTEDNLQMINQVMNEPHRVKKYIRGLRTNLTSIVQDLQDKRIDFAALKGDLFYTQPGIVFHEALKNQRRIKCLKEAGLLSTRDEGFLTNDSLSPEEIQCLRVYLTERSLQKSAQTLKFSIARVTSHIENVKSKLDCQHKQELLDKAAILESLGYF